MPVCVVSVLAIWLLPASWSGFIATSLIYSLVLLSLVVVTGFAGQISLAQYMLAGVAGWGAASLVGFYHWPIGFALLAGFVGTIGVGVGIGLPALRTRGVNLAIITLGFAATIEAMILENGALTGGAEGTTVGNFNLFGMDFSSLFHPQRFATLAFGVFVVCLIAVANLRRSQAGLQLIALRSNEKAAASLGIGVARLKLYAFGVAAGIAAISGMLTTFRYTYTSYGAFSSLSSIAAVGNGVIAGIGYVTGPVFGLLLSPDGIGYRPFESIPNVDNLLIAFGGLLLIVMLVVNPDGLASTHNLASFRRLRIWRSDPGRERAEDQIGAVVAEPIEMRARPSELEVRELSVRFGGVAALEHVNLVVKAGEIHGLIGPNGAGKTTFIDAVTGFVRASEGDIILGGESLSGYAAHRRVEKGLTRSFQNLELFEDLTVAENLRAGIPLSPVKLVSGFAWPKVPPLTPGAAASVRDFGIGKYLNHKPDQLPYGQRRLVAIARAVSTLPSIMLLDEPSSGLDEQDRDRLATLLQHEIREWGIGVLLVEHDIDLVQTVCDVVTVLDRGRVIACGPPAQVLGDPAVVTAYLGGRPWPSSPDSRRRSECSNEHPPHRDQGPVGRIHKRARRSGPEHKCVACGDRCSDGCQRGRQDDGPDDPRRVAVAPSGRRALGWRACTGVSSQARSQRTWIRTRIEDHLREPVGGEQPSSRPGRSSSRARILSGAFSANEPPCRPPVRRRAANAHLGTVRWPRSRRSCCSTSCRWGSPPRSFSA